jgi:hypothetical protein
MGVRENSVSKTLKQATMPENAPRGVACIDVHLGDIRQLFHSMDPAPFRERDLDPKAEEFIVESARELSRTAPLRLTVRITDTTSTPEDLAALPQAVHEHFARRKASTRVNLRRLLRSGFWSLLIGVSFVAAVNLVGDWLGQLAGGVFHESLVIGAWVALWRPLEILLYDWWPLLADVRLFNRLATMEVIHVVG